jgi:hypothetical protein
MTAQPSISGPLAYGTLAGYLLEQLPAEEAASAFGWLSGEPTEPVAEQIVGWAKEQIGESSIPLGAFLLFGLEKLHVLGSRGLVDAAAMTKFLDGLAISLLGATPEADREEFRTGYVALRSSGRTEATRPTPRASKPVASAAAPTAPPPQHPARKAEQQLTLLLERYGSHPKRKKKTEEAEAVEAAQIVTIAARSAKSTADLDRLLAEIERTTGRKKGNVFATLGAGLPSWDLPIPPKESDIRLPAQVEAIGRIIQLAENPAVALTRLKDLVTAAVEKFNQGSIAAAMWMFDVAEDAIKEKKVPAAAVESIREEAMESLSTVQIRKFAENRAKHGALRTTLDFFPKMRLEPLFQQLRGEPRAEKRRSLLGLIEVHEGAARAQALKRLETEIGQHGADTYYLRNLVYLLHRIPRENDDELPRLSAALGRLVEKGQNIYVVKEAATALGQIKNDESVRALTTCLAEIEVMIQKADTSLYPMAEMQKTLDRVVGAIARIGTAGALLVVARHGMKTNPALGDTRAQFSVLAEQDLSFHSGVLDVLLKALKEEIPGRLLGRLVPKKQEATVRLIEALSGTRSDDVDALLRDIAERFPGQDIGSTAAKILSKHAKGRAAPPAEPTATLSGELAFFGLPTVLQSLGDMRGTGILTVTTPQGELSSRLVVGEGKFLDAQIRNLRGVDAFYEILEHPIPGRFAFVPYPLERMKVSAAPQELIGLLFEAVRRQDELQLMQTMVPDDLPLQATGTQPSAPEGEQDPALMREVWLKASSGAPVGEWGNQIPSDSFRIRRMLSHWLETGALAGRG